MGLQLLILTLQVAGILLAGIVVASLGLARAGGALRLVAAGTGVAVAALLAATLPTSVRSAVVGLRDVRKALNVPQEGRDRFCTSEPGLPNTEFIDFLDHQMGQRDRYVMYMSPFLLEKSAALCVDFILLPRVQVERARDADWAVFFGATPPEWRERLRASSPDIYRVAPGLALVRLRPDAG
jgi:hypothetical protein